MALTEKNLLRKLYLIAFLLAIFGVAVVVRMFKIHFVEGPQLRAEAAERTERMFTIEPNKGSLFSHDGSLLATSVTQYEVRWDAVSVKSKDFEALVKPLSDSLSMMLGKPSAYYEQYLRQAKAKENRYTMIASKLDYIDFKRMESFPLFSKGPFKGGFISVQKTVRDHPLGDIAKRMVGYEKVDENGKLRSIGLEGAFSKYLNGVAGKRLKQRIAKGQWKPVGMNNTVEPQDGYDVVSTIDVGIQDIAHHALLTQLEKYKADHGTVVVMEVATGEIKAMSNLGVNAEGQYYERLNYAVSESHEPGSTFKVMSLVAALEDKYVDTNSIVDTQNGLYKVYNGMVRDSHKGGYGKITVSKALMVSSNTAFAKIINENYRDNPKKFVNRLRNMNLHQPLDLPIAGEGLPVIRYPGDKGWSGLSLAWMAYGYEVSLTPLQTLTFYNAIANNGEMVRPRLIKEIRSWDKVIQRFDKEVINPSICSEETLGKVRQILSDIVNKKGGTGRGLYDPNFSMAGKTGTTQKNYASGDKDKLKYISTFSGYFPADNPKYSCIVVIHEPDKGIGYYGADVSGPVFKAIAQKIYTSNHNAQWVDAEWKPSSKIQEQKVSYELLTKGPLLVMPDLDGLPGRDAVALLENNGVSVRIQGMGQVKAQSLVPGTPLVKGTTVQLTLE